MKKFILSIILSIFVLFGSANADYMPDLVITGADGIWTDNRAYATLSDAITAIGGSDQTLVVASPQTVTDLTIPSNITLKFVRTGMITYSGQLTIQTPNIESSDRQIFDATGSGEADFARGTNLRSTWFEDFHEMFDQTVDNYVILTICSGWSANVDATAQVGNNVNLKWEGAGNRIVINSGFELSNIKNIDAGRYQIFGGSGDLDFVDGTSMKLVWFPRLRSIVTWIESEEITIRVEESSTVDYDNTVPTNMALVVDKGATLTIAAGRTLTSNGLVEIRGTIAGSGALTIGSTGELCFRDGITNLTGAITLNGRLDAGLDYIFTGAGAVTLGNFITSALPEWWGIDGTNDEVAIAAADNALTDGTVILSQDRNYSIGANLTITNNLEVRDGAVLIDAANENLVINGMFKHGLSQCFDWDGAGAVSFGDLVTEALPEWWEVDGVNDEVAIDAADASLTNGAIVLKQVYNYAIDDDLTLSNRLIMNDGAICVVATTKTLTINGPFGPGLYQVFSLSGTGAVDLTDAEYEWVYPEWFGAVGDCDPTSPSTTTNDVTPLRAAHTSAGVGGRIKLTKFYCVTLDDSSKIFDPVLSGQTWVGNGWRTGIYHDSIIDYTDSIFNITGAVSDLHFSNMKLQGRQNDTDQTESSGRAFRIYMPDGAVDCDDEANMPQKIVIENIWINDGGSDGIFIGIDSNGSSATAWMNDIYINKVLITDQEHGIGIYENKGRVYIDNVTIKAEGRQQRGLYIYGNNVVGNNLIFAGGQTATSIRIAHGVNNTINNVIFEDASSVEIYAGASGTVRNFSASNWTGVQHVRVWCDTAATLMESFSFTNINLDGRFWVASTGTTKVQDVTLTNCNIRYSAASGEALRLDGFDNVNLVNTNVESEIDSTYPISFGSSNANGFSMRGGRVTIKSGGVNSGVRFTGAYTWDDIVFDGVEFTRDTDGAGSELGIDVAGSATVTKLNIINCHFNELAVGILSDGGGKVQGNVSLNDNYATNVTTWAWSGGTTFIGTTGGTPRTCGSLADGTTGGKAQIQEDIHYEINRKLYFKAATDDLFDCQALTDTGANEYCKVLLLLNSAGTASVVQGAVAASQAAAEFPITVKTIVGWLEVSQNHNFDAAVALSAGCTYHNGVPGSKGVAGDY